MAKIDKKMIEAIVNAVGGSQNIAKNGNCMTRLRLSLHDSTLADHEAIKKIDGVMGVIESDTQLQIIVGPGKAQQAKELVELYLEQIANGDVAPQSAPNAQQEKTLEDIAKAQKNQMKAKQTSWIQTFLAKFATIFTPLIPGFIAAGLLLGVATLLQQSFVVGFDDVNPLLLSTIAYLTVFSKGLFLFLGILVGYYNGQVFL